VRIQEFDFSVDLLRAILWQRNDAVNLQALLEKKNKNGITSTSVIFGRVGIVTFLIYKPQMISVWRCGL
jgi:hypothetical protein